MCHRGYPGEIKLNLGLSSISTAVVIRKICLYVFSRNDYAYSSIVLALRDTLVTYFKFTTCIRDAGCQPVPRDRRNQRYDRSLECDILGDIGATFLVHVSFRLAPPDPVGFCLFCDTVTGREALEEI